MVADTPIPNMMQSQNLAKQNCISIACTKSDFIKLLDQVEPGIDHSDLTGSVLKAKLTEHEIGLLRTKDELAKLLVEKQRALKNAQEISERLRKWEGLQLLTTDELRGMARSKGVSIYMTKQDVIDLLDRLEPGLGRSELGGQPLIEAKKRHNIGVFKNKPQLIKAIEKAAREEAVEKVKREAARTLMKARGSEE